MVIAFICLVPVILDCYSWKCILILFMKCILNISVSVRTYLKTRIWPKTSKNFRHLWSFMLLCHIWKVIRIWKNVRVSKQWQHFEWALINMYYTTSKIININNDRCSVFLIGIFLKSFKHEEGHSEGLWEKIPQLLF